MTGPPAPLTVSVNGVDDDVTAPPPPTTPTVTVCRLPGRNPPTVAVVEVVVDPAADVWPMIPDGQGVSEETYE